jgi:hypothetical protein
LQKELEFPSGRVGFLLQSQQKGVKIIDAQESCLQKNYDGDLLFAIDN